MSISLKCNKDDEDIGHANPTENLKQFTPNKANWDGLNDKPLRVSLNKFHAPEEIG